MDILFRIALLASLWTIVLPARSVGSGCGKIKISSKPGPSPTLIRKPIIVSSENPCSATFDGENWAFALADDFQGKAAIVVEGPGPVVIKNVTIIGNRARLAQTQALPPYDRTFYDHFGAHGVAARGATKVTISGVTFREIAGFAILASRVSHLDVDGVTVENSGSRGPNQRNNTTGGILIEDGSFNWTVRRSRFSNILGNAVWTHSRYSAPRNEHGFILNNTFSDIGRDAIQIGHALVVRVAGNRGDRIGFPFDAVDVEGGGTPVGIDTAGNVDATYYVDNEFHEINGKCIDLDGFHHGVVRDNRCITTARDLPHAHFGIVMNNTNPDMQSVGITITGNYIEGAKWGGIFVLGAGHTIAGNTLVHLQTTHCSDPAAPAAGCVFLPAEPAMLRTGIYLGERAERPARTRANRIVDNTVSGWRMDTACIGHGPHIASTDNTIHGNRCQHQP